MFFLLIVDSVERDYHGKSTADRIKVEVHYFKPNHGLKYVKKTLLKKKKKLKPQTMLQICLQTVNMLNDYW